MTDKTREIMQRIIDEKKQKSASQGLNKRAPASIGSNQPGIKKKKPKKGGLFDK
ncbi:hypothetical protein [Dehalobacterium formicoaceticum]|uniref:DNA primase n=1 Tax=Dehalobacterium formicoaceticum TaxID=51515 RepID=A0ABT1Y2I7_9FIRM|nr:hypothetical protein [Dehalobacterium formicoaceticum]MCR6545083.1 hypothetical protein [Dehalobacterium formicoaceticum]